jgi:ribonuclease PH
MTDAEWKTFLAETEKVAFSTEYNMTPITEEERKARSIRKKLWWKQRTQQKENRP